MICLVSTAHISVAIAQYLTADQVTSDLNALVDYIHEYNPALDVYNPDFDKQAQSVIDEADSMSLTECFGLISRICALSNEGHFNVGNWEDDVHKGFLDNTIRYMPLAVRIMDDRVYVAYDMSDEFQLLEHDEIHAINGKSMDEILDEMYRHLCGDGSIKSYRQRKAMYGFSWMYYLYVDRSQQFDIEYSRTGMDGTMRVTVAALPLEVRSANYKARYTSDQDADQAPTIDDMYTFEIQDVYALLTLKSFDYKLVDKYEVDAVELYEDIFTRIKEGNINKLIIDVRGNTGGRIEFADEIVPFVIGESDDPFLKRTISWSGKTKTYKLPKPAKQVFEGEIVLLVDGYTYSAGSNFARYLKEYGNTTVIGQETGTRYEGYAAGSRQSVTLPNSNITIGIPRYHIMYPESQKQTTSNRGLIPDIHVQKAPEDYRNDRDPAMSKALELID